MYQLNSTSKQQKPMFGKPQVVPGKQSAVSASASMLPPSSQIPRPRRNPNGTGFSPVPNVASNVASKAGPNVVPLRGEWMSAPEGQEQNDLAQRGMDEITRVAGQQAAFEPNVQPGPRWRPGFDPRAMMQQAPMEVQGWQRPMSLGSQQPSGMNDPAMMALARQAMQPQLENIGSGAKLYQNQVQNAIASAQRTRVMDSLAQPLGAIAGAFMGRGANQMLADYGNAKADSMNQQGRQISDLIANMQNQAIKGGGFVDNYMRYWDPNSPTNRQQDFANQMADHQAYNQALQTQQQGYRDTTGRQQMLGQLDINQAKQLLDQDQFVNQVQQQGITNRRNDLLDSRAYEHQMFGDEMASYNAQNQLAQQNYERGLKTQELERQGRMDAQQLAQYNDSRIQAQLAAKQAAQNAALDRQMKMGDLLAKLGTPAKNGMTPLNTSSVKAAAIQSGLIPPTVTMPKPGGWPGETIEITDPNWRAQSLSTNMTVPPAALAKYKSLPQNERAAERASFAATFGIDPGE